MDIDFEPYFKKYQDFVAIADTLFSRVSSEFPASVSCKPACSDCCYAVFDLTFIEALYINKQFNLHFSGDRREMLLEKANRTDRELYRLKRAAYKSVMSGDLSEGEVLERLGRERVRCPLLNEEQRCDMYMFRPITCRLYGVPMMIGGKSHVCGLSAFEVGEKCPTINIDGFNQKLIELSRTLTMDIGSKYTLSDLLVPLSMAILTDYDESYLGIGKENETEMNNK